MSAHYDLMPLGPIDDNWLQNFAGRLGLVIPEGWKNSRNPTAAEIRFVACHLAKEGFFTELPEFNVRGGDLEAVLNIGGDETLLAVEDYAADHDEDKPHPISFTYGTPELVLPICERLARLCGPFLLTMDGAFFVIVTAGVPSYAEWAADDF